MIKQATSSQSSQHKSCKLSAAAKPPSETDRQTADRATKSRKDYFRPTVVYSSNSVLSLCSLYKLPLVSSNRKREKLWIVKLGKKTLFLKTKIKWMKIITVIYATFAVPKRKPENNSGL